MLADPQDHLQRVQSHWRAKRRLQSGSSSWEERKQRDNNKINHIIYRIFTRCTSATVLLLTSLSSVGAIIVIHTDQFSAYRLAYAKNKRATCFTFDCQNNTEFWAFVWVWVFQHLLAKRLENEHEIFHFFVRILKLFVRDSAHIFSVTRLCTSWDSREFNVNLTREWGEKSLEFLEISMLLQRNKKFMNESDCRVCERDCSRMRWMIFTHMREFKFVYCNKLDEIKLESNLWSQRRSTGWVTKLSRCVETLQSEFNKRDEICHHEVTWRWLRPSRNSMRYSN